MIKAIYLIKNDIFILLVINKISENKNFMDFARSLVIRYITTKVNKYEMKHKN